MRGHTQRLTDDFQRGRLQEGFCFLVCGEQGFHFAAQVILSSAGFFEKGGPLAFFHFESEVKHLFGAGPGVRLHGTSVVRAGTITRLSLTSNRASLFPPTLEARGRFLSCSAPQRNAVPPRDT